MSFDRADDGSAESPAPGSELIAFDDVEMRYSGVTVLTVTGVRLFEGDRILLHGANGSGKSTFLKLLAGVIKGKRGRLSISPDGYRKRRVGYLPQHQGLYPELSLRQNLDLRRHLYGLEGQCDSVLVDELGLRPFLETSFASLSGGYQRLAAIAAALISQPTWVLLDEPFGGVDPERRETLVEQLGRIVRSVPLFVVALPTVEELPFINRVLHIDSGRL